MPFFSIIIPTKNREDLFRRAYSSVINQTFRDFEVVVVDDGSDTIYSMEKVDKSKMKYTRYELSKGVSFARNFAVEKSTGEWLVFLDDDDEFKLDYLSVLYKNINTSSLNACFFLCAVEIVRYQKVFHLVTLKKNDTSRSVLENLMSMGFSNGVALRRSDYQQMGGLDESLVAGEDTDFFLRLVRAGIKPCFLPNLGVVKHNHNRARLSLNYAATSKSKVVEKILIKNFDVISQDTVALNGFLNWSLKNHIKNSSYISFFHLLFVFITLRIKSIFF